MCGPITPINILLSLKKNDKQYLYVRVGVYIKPEVRSYTMQTPFVKPA